VNTNIKYQTFPNLQLSWEKTDNQDLDQKMGQEPVGAT
jgi:hypothetical protein